MRWIFISFWMPFFPLLQIINLSDFSFWRCFRFHWIILPNNLSSFNGFRLCTIIVATINAVSWIRSYPCSLGLESLSNWICAVCNQKLHLKLLFLGNLGFMVRFDHISIWFLLLESGHLFFFNSLELFFLLKLLFSNYICELWLKLFVVVVLFVFFKNFLSILSPFQSFLGDLLVNFLSILLQIVMIERLMQISQRLQ